MRLTSANSAAAELAERPENCALAARRSLPPCREATPLVAARCSVARWSRPRTVRVKNLRRKERSAHARSDLRQPATSAAKRGALERTQKNFSTSAWRRSRAAAREECASNKGRRRGANFCVSFVRARRLVSAPMLGSLRLRVRERELCVRMKSQRLTERREEGSIARLPGSVRSRLGLVSPRGRELFWTATR